jgi:phosphoglycerate kinase
MKKLETIDFTGKVALVRCDLNVPMSDGEITDDNRIVEAVPTLKLVASKGAKVVILSHLGRVKTDEDKGGKSLKPVAQSLSQHLGANVTFVGETRGSELEAAIASLKPGEFLMMENTRFEDVNGSKESKNCS